MILDATAAYRAMYQMKDNPNFIYIDIERKLKTKPTVFCDNTNTPFPDKSYDSIFYDPPHDVGDKAFPHEIMGTRLANERAKAQPFGASYFGWDKYKNQQELIVHIWRAQKEFHRILKDDGLLWVKWCECKLTLKRILRLFEDWDVVMISPHLDPRKTFGSGKAFWVVLTKKKKEVKQLYLGDAKFTDDGVHPAVNIS